MDSLQEICCRDESVISLLSLLWEKSVSVSHSFLSQQDIQRLRPTVKECILQAAGLYAYKSDSNEIVAFMAIEQDKVIMLFVAPKYMGQGIGKKLMQFALSNLKIQYVDVNEQNPRAISFYEGLGMRAYQRSEYDEYNNHFPILHLKRKRPAD
jgi:putative acetyltransferase